MLTFVQKMNIGSFSKSRWFSDIRKADDYFEVNLNLCYCVSVHTCKGVWVYSS